MLDEDPRGEFQRIGHGQAANFASAFLQASSQAILQSRVGSTIKLRALESLNQMVVSVAFGQYLDVQNPADEAAYWRVVQMKSAPFFRTVFELGAIFGGAPMAVVRDMGEVGRVYGEMIQIHFRSFLRRPWITQVVIVFWNFASAALRSRRSTKRRKF